MTLLHDYRWAIRLWIAAIGAWLVIDASRSWDYSSSDHRPVPPSPLTATLADRDTTWFKRFAESPKGTNGLPIVDIPDIHQEPDTPPRRAPASQRTRGNRLELFRSSNGTIVSYDVSGDKGLIVIETQLPTVQFTIGDDRHMQPVLKLPDAVAIDAGQLPSTFFEGAITARRTTVRLFDATGKSVQSFRLSIENSAEISVFKGTKSKSPLAIAQAQKLLLTPEQRWAQSGQERGQLLNEIDQIVDIGDGRKPSPKPRSCAYISPVIFRSSANPNGPSIKFGSLGYDAISRSITVQGVPLSSGAYTLEIDVPIAAGTRQTIKQQATTLADVLKTPFFTIPAAALARPTKAKLRIGSAGKEPDFDLDITAKQLHDLQLCHDDPGRKLSDTVGKD